MMIVSSSAVTNESPEGKSHTNFDTRRANYVSFCRVGASPKTLDEELAALSPAHRASAKQALALRAQSREIARALRLDEGDVYHQLKQLSRSPAARLRLGLAHGRLRRLID
jgi:hypothetical protein